MGGGRNGDHGGLVRGQREFKGCVAFTGREDGGVGRRGEGREDQDGCACERELRDESLEGLNVRASDDHEGSVREGFVRTQTTAGR